MLYPVLHRLERLGYVEARWEAAAETGRLDALSPREPGTLQWFLTPKQLRRLGDKKPKKVSAS
jgi:hypothetical protein